MTNDFKKVVRLGILPPPYLHRAASVFCAIEYKAGKLSITGVEGPTPNGDAIGGCGQIVMSLAGQVEQIEPAPGWSHDLIRQFFAIWDRWHLNDMRPNCEHMTGPEWEPHDVTLYHFNLTGPVRAEQKAAEAAALDALKKGETFTPTERQAEVSALPYSYTHHAEALPDGMASFYAPEAKAYTWQKGPTETKSTGWLHPEEHPEGVLGKACPVCGYKYGSAWKREEVPAEVLAFLRSLPNTDRQPAWV